MLRSVEDLERYAIQGRDGEVGRVRDVYFDDTSWVVRYLSVEAGPWLFHRPLLIPPSVTGPADWTGKVLALALTRDEVRRDPRQYTPKPVPRQLRMGFIGPPGFPYQSAGPGSWSAADRTVPATSVSAGRSDLRSSLSSAEGNGLFHADDRAAAQSPVDADPHLHSGNAIRQCRIRALDGIAGQVRGMLIEENAWVVRFLIVATSEVGDEEQVLIASPWILDVEWSDALIRVDLTREQIKESTNYVPPGSRQAHRAAAPHES